MLPTFTLSETLTAIHSDPFEVIIRRTGEPRMAMLVPPNGSNTWERDLPARHTSVVRFRRGSALCPLQRQQP